MEGRKEKGSGWTKSETKRDRKNGEEMEEEREGEETYMREDRD